MSPATATPTTLTDARTHLLAHGWAVLDPTFTPAETAVIAATAMQVTDREMRADTGAFTTDHGPAGALAPRKIDYPFQKHPAFRAFILDDRIRSAASAALGQPAYLMRDQIFCKPPHFGTAKPYHQENASLGYHPAQDMIVTWIALDDATTDNGCLRVIDGSHTRLWPHHPDPAAPYNHLPPPEAIDLDREVLLPVPAGAVVLLASQVLHSSAPNPTPAWRRAYTAHWTTATIGCTTDARRYGYSHTAGDGHRLTHRAP